MGTAFQCPDCGTAYSKRQDDYCSVCKRIKWKPLVRVLVFSESELKEFVAKTMFNTEYPDDEWKKQNKQTKIIWRGLAKRFLISQGEKSQGKSPAMEKEGLK